MHILAAIGPQFLKVVLKVADQIQAGRNLVSRIQNQLYMTKHIEISDWKLMIKQFGSGKHSVSRELVSF